MKKIILVYAFFLSLPLVAQIDKSQNFPPPETPVEIKATRTLSKITIDGQLNEEAWNAAYEISDFFRIEPQQGGKYNYATFVKLLYDDKNLYVGVFCADSLGKKGVRIQDLRRDFDQSENDVFGIQIDAQNTKQYAMSFQTTPYGNQRDLQNFNDNNIDNDWNALWSVRTQRTDSGYVAEFAIPFKSIRYDKPEAGKPVEWGITFFRLARRDFEQTVFPAIPQSFSPYRMTYAAKLTGLEVPPPSANIRIEPYTLFQYDENKSGDVITDKDNNIKVGGDVKWAISPNAVFDLTINTDFAQADVDRAVNNLERFNIFFPEQRQFFLENSGIWAGADSFRVRPFFSRTIGLEGDFNAAPAPIDVGARFTDRNEKRTFAGLYVHQRETENSPAANFGLARYIHNYGKENNIGLMVTHRLDEKSDELALSQQQNTTFTLDGFTRPKNELTLSYLASLSYDKETETTGYAGRISAAWITNKFYMGYLNTFVSEDYNPEMGFVFQNNVMRHSGGGYYVLRPKKIPWIRRSDPGFFVNYYHDFEDPENFQQANIYVFPLYIWFKDNSFIEGSFTHTWQNINFDFAPLGLQIEQGRYFYTRYLIAYNTDRSKKFSTALSFDFGKFYNGTRNTLQAGLRYAPIPHIAVAADYEYNNLKDMGIANENLDTNLYTASLRLALNPRTQLSAFYQYNSFDEQGRWNVRFSWEYQPLSFIYIVFNDTQTDIFSPPQNSRQFISKITFLKQF